MLKRGLSIVMSLALTIPIIPAQAEAFEDKPDIFNTFEIPERELLTTQDSATLSIQSKAAEDIFTYTTKYNGTATITGTVKGSIQPTDDVIVPDTIKGKKVTNIANSAFRSIKANSVTLPTTLRVIASNAFYGARIKDLIVLGNIESIEAGAFNSIEVGTSLIINGGDKPINIDGQAFRYSKISGDLILNGDVNFSERGTYYGYTFMGLKAHNVTINGDINIIPPGAFNLAETDKVVINGSVLKNIARMAIHGDTYNELIINGEVPEIKELAAGESKIKSLIINSQNPTIIEPYSFRGSNIDKLVIKGGTSFIGKEAFAKANVDVLEIVKEDLPVTFGPDAFYKLKANSSQFKIPRYSILIENSSSFQSLFKESEWQSLNIEELTFEDEVSSDRLLTNAIIKNKKLITPKSLKTLGHTFAEGSNVYTENLIENVTLHCGLETISTRALANNNIEKIEIPSSVTKIAANAFEGNRQPLTIIGVKDSEAHKYALRNNYEFKEAGIFENPCNPLESKITVNYKDETGSVVFTEYITKPYEGLFIVNAHSIPKEYKLKDGELSSKEITIDKDNYNQTVEFAVVKKDSIPLIPLLPSTPTSVEKGKVTVEYKDENDVEIKESKIINIETIGKIKEIAPEIEGYTLTSTHEGFAAVLDVTKNYTIKFTYKLNTESSLENIEYNVNEEGTVTVSLSKNASILPTDSLVIPEQIKGRPVTHIAEHSFIGVVAKSIVLPDTIVSIGQGAFTGVNVDSLVLSKNLEYIGSFALDKAIINSPLDIQSPNKTLTLNRSFLQSAEINGDLNISAKALEIKEFALSYVDMKDKNIKIDNIKTAGPYGIYRMSANNIELNGDLIQVEKWGLSDIRAIDTLTINADLNFTEPPGKYEYGMSQLKVDKLVINGNLNKLPSFTFDSSSDVREVTINGNISEGLSDYAVNDTKLDSFIVNGEVSKIGQFALSGEIDIILINNKKPIAVTEWSFSGVTSKDITFTGGAYYIGVLAFSGAVVDNLNIINENVPVTIDTMAFTGFTGKDTDMKFPRGSIARGAPKHGSSVFRGSSWKSIDMSTLEIAAIEDSTNFVKEFNTQDKHLTTTLNLVNVGESYAEGSNLDTLTLQCGIESIGVYAFANNNLSQVIIPSSVQTINYTAFEGNTKPIKIIGEKDSEAEKFAVEQGFEFEEKSIFNNICNPIEWGVTINYDNSKDETISTKFLSKPAKGDLTIFANEIPKGYELVKNEKASVTVTIDENNHSPIVTFKIKWIPTPAIPIEPSVPITPPEPPVTEPEVKGIVTTRYVDEEGISISPMKVTQIESEGIITETALNIEGYALISSEVQTVNITDVTKNYIIEFKYKSNGSVPKPSIPEVPESKPERPSRPNETVDEVIKPEPVKPSKPVEEVIKPEPVKPSKPVEEVKILQRAVRVGSDGKYYTAPHYGLEDNSLKITSKYPDDVIIIDRVKIPFKDVSVSLFSYDELTDLYNYLIVQGKNATTYAPNDDITRGQFSAMLYRSLELRPNNSDYTFKDVRIYKDEVEALYQAGIITGYDNGKFGESDTLTRQQASAMIVRMLNYLNVNTTYTTKPIFKDDKKIAPYAKEAVYYLASEDILDNGKLVNFNPKNNLTRAQMAKVLMRSLRMSELY